jgi:hypothetical protein
MIKSEERTNAVQKRNGTSFAVTATVCGCPDPNCGGWHNIHEERPLPTPDEADKTLRQRKAAARIDMQAPIAQPSNQLGRAKARQLF